MRRVLFIAALAVPLIVFLYFLQKPEDAVKEIRMASGLPANQITNDMKANDTLEMKDKSYSTIHSEAIMIDTHNDFIYQVFSKGADIGVWNSFTHSDLPKFREGGVDVQVFAVWIPGKELRRSYEFTVSQISSLRKMADEHSSGFEFAGSYDDIIRITGEGKLCGLIGIEGGTAIGNDEQHVRDFYEMGVRYIGLTWNNSNLIASSAKDETERGRTGGLTDFGRNVVKLMNEAGMLVDVSHLGERAFWDVIEVSEDPVIASHSNCYAVNPHYRNLTDEQIKAIADMGGYIGINFYDKFLVRKGGAEISDVIDHIDHIRDLVGVDVIGIGADYDGGITPPAGLENVTKYPELTKALLERGYSEYDVKKILGENFLRVFRKVCG